MFCINVDCVGPSVNYPNALDAYGFEEDSGDALSPEQPASHESQAAAPSPGEPRALETPCPPPLPTITNNHTILQVGTREDLYPLKYPLEGQYICFIIPRVAKGGYIT